MLKSFEEKYKEVCEILVGDSDSWTHEEIKIRLNEAVDALLKIENAEVIQYFGEDRYWIQVESDL